MNTIKYLGMLGEATGCEKEEMACAGKTANQLTIELQEKHGKLATMSFKIAVSNNLVNDDFIIPEGSEIALLPPFAGG